MSVVRQRRANGAVYLYESRNVWDEDRQKMRTVRTYLGREDPETGELIPTSGHPGRKRAGGDVRDVEATALAAPDQELAATADAPDESERIAALEAALEAAIAERDALAAELARANSAIEMALSALGAAGGAGR